MSRGRLMAVVGPSGAGKDTVMRAMAAARPGLGRVRRVITRPADPGGERHEPVSEAEFESRLREGGFVLHWRAHGLRYGVPVGIGLDLAMGRDLLVNLSRGMLAEAQGRFQPFAVLHLVATREVLAARLAARGREAQAEVAERLDGADRALPESVGPVVRLDTDAPAERLALRALARLYPARAWR